MAFRANPLASVRSSLESMIGGLSDAPQALRHVDFTKPAGDPGLFGPDSISWRVNANGVTMMIGGITAVLLELAEPRVRSGVWDHTDFKTDPVGRMKRTGFAAMVTTYGSVGDVEAVTSRVRKMHSMVTGTTPEGIPYRADEPELLDWVHLTAIYGFLRAYVRYAAPGLPLAEQDRYYRESLASAPHYGAKGMAGSVAEARVAMRRMEPKLVRHPILGEFLRLVSDVPILSKTALPVQRLLVQAAIDCLPVWAQQKLELDAGRTRRIAARPIVSGLARLAEAVLPTPIADQARARAAAGVRVAS